MKARNQTVDEPAAEQLAEPGQLRPLLTRSMSVGSPGGVVVGELIGTKDGGRTPLVLYPGQTGSAAVPARSVVDLHAAHIGKQVVLMFDAGDPTQPIVMGVLRDANEQLSTRTLEQFEVEADGERLIVSARAQLVLRCGKASITLTRAGKVLIEGAYVSSRSSGVNRVKGGSVQLN